METSLIGRTLAGMALSAIAGFAQAQSSVTLFGTVDNNLTYGKGSISNAKKVGTAGLAGSRVLGPFGRLGRRTLALQGLSPLPARPDKRVLLARRSLLG